MVALLTMAGATGDAAPIVMGIGMRGIYGMLAGEPPAKSFGKAAITSLVGKLIGGGVREFFGSIFDGVSTPDVDINTGSSSETLIGDLNNVISNEDIPDSMKHNLERIGSSIRSAERIALLDDENEQISSIVDDVKNNYEVDYQPLDKIVDFLKSSENLTPEVQDELSKSLNSYKGTLDDYISAFKKELSGINQGEISSDELVDSVMKSHDELIIDSAVVTNNRILTHIDRIQQHIENNTNLDDAARERLQKQIDFLSERKSVIDKPMKE